MRAFKRRSNRIKPLLDIHGRWESERSTYPETLFVAMRDGRIVRYTIDAKPVSIHVGKNGWERKGTQVIGYQFRANKKSPAQMTSLFRRRLHREQQ